MFDAHSTQRISRAVRLSESRLYPQSEAWAGRPVRESAPTGVVKVRNETDRTLFRGYVVGLGNPVDYNEDHDGDILGRFSDESVNEFTVIPYFLGEDYDADVHRGSFAVIMDDDVVPGESTWARVSGLMVVHVDQPLGDRNSPGWDQRFVTAGPKEGEDYLQANYHGTAVRHHFAPDNHLYTDHFLIDVGGDPGPYQFSVFNMEAEDVPAYGVMEVLSFDESEHYYNVRKPTGAGGLYLFNWHKAVPSEGWGRGGNAIGLPVLLNADDDPTPGAFYGPVPSTWGFSNVPDGSWTPLGGGPSGTDTERMAPASVTQMLRGIRGYDLEDDSLVLSNDEDGRLMWEPIFDKVKKISGYGNNKYLVTNGSGSVLWADNPDA